jgi:hypothetical protein
MISNMSEKSYAFIDGQNLYLGIKECGWELNYKHRLRFMNDLKSKIGE